MAFRDQFDNKILFVLRGEHVQGASQCIVGSPASDQLERRMGRIGLTSPQAFFHVNGRISFLHVRVRKVFRRAK